MEALLVKDHKIARRGLADLLSVRFSGLTILSAETVNEALVYIATRQPNIVIADFCTGDVGEATGLERIVDQSKDSPVIAVDRRYNTRSARRALTAGARAYLPMTSTPEILDAVVALVMSGGEYFPQHGGSPEDDASSSCSWVDGLPARSQRVLALLLEGKTNREIAAQLGISPAAVSLSVRDILRGAGVRNRTQAVLKAKALDA